MAKRTLSLAVGVALAAGLTSVGSATSAHAAAQCSIPASNLTITATNQTHSNTDVQAWDVFKVSYELKNLDGLAAGSCITFAAPAAFTEFPSGTVELKAPDGSLIGTQTMAGGVVTVTLTTDYAATHKDVRVWGSYTAKVKDTVTPGTTLPLAFTVNGTVTTTQDVTTGVCVGCSVLPVDRAQKWGWDTEAEDGVAIVSPVVAKAGTTVTFTDTLTSAGQSFAGTPTAYAYTELNAWGSPVSAEVLPVTVAGDGTWTVTTTRDGQAVRLVVPMAFTGAGPWTDTATVTVAGHDFQTSTKVVQNTADGAGTGTTVPPAPTPTPTPEVTKPVVTKPDVPVKPEGTIDAPVPNRRFTVQVDTYSWRNSAWFGNRIAAFDDDYRLRYREDAFLWQAKAAKKYTSYGHTFVSFTAPADSSQAELVAAYNAVAPKNLRITSTSRLSKVGASGRVTDVWVLGPGATTKAAWGPQKNVDQLFLGRR